jgi:PAS domain S-box-containing protein
MQEPVVQENAMNSNSRIIIVDDEPRICETLKFFLENNGYEVESALNGIQALALSDTKTFDLFLLDIGLPHIDGIELMSHVLQKDPNALVILMTGNATVDSAVAALKTGAYDYLKKPIEIDDLLKTIQDCLQQKRLLDQNRDFAAKLKISEERYRFIVQNCPDIIYTIDEKGCFLFVNEAIKRLLGYEPAALLHQPWISIVYEKDLEKARWFLRERGEGGCGMAGTQIRLKLKEDTSRFRFFEIRKFNTNLVPEFNELSHSSKRPLPAVVGAYGAARDITYRKQLESQLAQNDKMDAINTLAGGIAHDFNNILMGIQGYISLMLLDITPGNPHHNKLKNIEDYIQHAAKLTNQILDFARNEKYESRITDINGIVGKSVDLFGRTKKQLRIHTCFQPDIYPVDVDPPQIEQAMLNIFINAWQAMENSGDLYVKTQNFMLNKKNMGLMMVKPGEYVKLTITDNGCGMDEETMQHIFDPFFTTKDMGKGNGLGLTSTYNIIKNHEGGITVKSKPGKGTTFEIYLPATEKQQGYTMEETDNALFKGTETILLVDDEEMILEITKLMLIDLGYHVITAKCGTEAIHLYQQQQETIDLIILDMIMPDMEGGTVVDQIRQINPEIKILLASGYNLSSKIGDTLKKKCNGFIQKPFDLHKLSRELRHLRAES